MIIKLIRNVATVLVVLLLLLLSCASCGHLAYSYFTVDELQDYQIEDYFKVDELDFARIEGLVIIPSVKQTSHESCCIYLEVYSEKTHQIVTIKEVEATYYSRQYFCLKEYPIHLEYINDIGLYMDVVEAGTIPRDSSDTTKNQYIDLMVSLQVDDSFKEVRYRINIKSVFFPIIME
ncbi:MAG: hypothetical protein IK082_06950 [Oscillospiraceae bacterium]|nr:hypothetical protein [Oscillospiraceae bacterium]